MDTNSVLIGIKLITERVDPVINTLWETAEGDVLLSSGCLNHNFLVVPRKCVCLNVLKLNVASLVVSKLLVDEKSF